MQSKDDYYGRGLYLTKDVLFRVPARTLDVSGRSQVLLPSRTGLLPGGPIFILVNTTGSAIPIKDSSGTLVKNLPAHSVAEVLLGTSKWVLLVDAYNTAKTWSSNGATARSIAVGYEVAATGVTLPTSYDPIICTGGYRRARSCGTGAKANIWMPDTDVTPNFVAGVGAFSFLGQCFYFKESDRLLTGHGPLLASSDVSWYDTCDLCTASLICQSSNPNWPPAVVVKIQDNYQGKFTGVHTLPFDGGGYSSTLADPDYYFMKLECDPTGWIGKIGYDLTGLPGGATVYSWSRFQFASPAVLPSIGSYGFLDGSLGGSECAGIGCWNTSTFEVLGFSS